MHILEDAPGGGKRTRTRRKLIDAAAQVIGEKGYERASLEEIAQRAGMTRGAIYGNFKNKEELFLELVASRWKPIVPPLDSTAGFREHMRALGRAVAAEARAREAYAAAATSFQLYVLTHKAMQAQLTKQNAIVYRKMAAEVIKHIPEKSLPMPAPQFVRVLDALISGLLFTYFQTPSLIGEEVFVSAFEAFAR